MRLGARIIAGRDGLLEMSERQPDTQEKLLTFGLDLLAKKTHGFDDAHEVRFDHVSIADHCG